MGTLSSKDSNRPSRSQPINRFSTLVWFGQLAAEPTSWMGKGTLLHAHFSTYRTSTVVCLHAHWVELQPTAKLLQHIVCSHGKTTLQDRVKWVSEWVPQAGVPDIHSFSLMVGSLTHSQAHQTLRLTLPSDLSRAIKSGIVQAVLSFPHLLGIVPIYLELSLV